MRYQHAILIILGSSWLALASCAGNKQGALGDDTANEAATPVEAEAEAEAADNPAGDAVALEGTVIKKPWSKSTESWNAGGSEYYVLDVGDTAVEHRSAAEGVTLRPTDAVSAAALDAMVGQRVRVMGSYVEAKPYTPQDPAEQYPQDMDGKPLPRGAGFEVGTIEAIE